MHVEMLLSPCCIPSTRGWASQPEPELLPRAFTLVCLVSRSSLVIIVYVHSSDPRVGAFLQIHRSLRSSCWSYNCSVMENAVLRGSETRLRFYPAGSHQGDMPLTGVREGRSFAERKVWRCFSVHLMPSERWSMCPGARPEDMTGAFINVS